MLEGHAIIESFEGFTLVALYFPELLRHKLELPGSICFLAQTVLSW
jgi:hypothetical protein